MAAFIINDLPTILYGKVYGLSVDIGIRMLLATEFSVSPGSYLCPVLPFTSQLSLTKLTTTMSHILFQLSVLFVCPIRIWGIICSFILQSLIDLATYVNLVRWCKPEPMPE